MTVMPGLRQFVSLVSKGGTPIMIADAFGNPYPTTGHGSLVFNEGAELFDPVLHGVVVVEDAIHLPSGTAAQPPLTFGPSPYNFGMYEAGVSVGGLPIMTFEANGVSVIGNITYSGVLQGAFHTPMTTRGDLYYFSASGPARLALGGAGNVLASNGTDLVYVPPAAGGTLTAVSQVDGETVATPNPIIAVGTVGLADTGVAPGTYGDATNLPRIQVDAKGRLISVIQVPVVTGGTVTSVTPGVGLTSSPNPIVAAGTINLADTAVAPAIYGSATNIPQITVDQQGRITLASNVPVSIPPAGVTSISQGTGITLTPNPLVATGTIAVNTTVVALKTDLNAYLLLAGGTVTGTVIFQPPATLVANAPAITVNQTWNNAAADFKAISGNVNVTAAGGNARVIDLQIDGHTGLILDKNGTQIVWGNGYYGGSVHASTGSGIPPAAALDSGFMMSTTPNFGVTFTTNVPAAAFAKGSMALANGGNGMPWVNYDGSGAGWARAASLVVGPTAPAAAPDDQLWWNSDASVGGGQLMIRYNDGSTSQWVPAAPGATTPTTPGGDFYASQQVALLGGNQILKPAVITGNSGSYYNPSTGRWQPPAGRYYVWSTICAGLSTSAVVLATWLLKNGVAVGQTSYQVPGASNWQGDPQASAILDMNGTDYIEALGYVSVGTNLINFMTFGAFPLSGLKGPTGDPPAGSLTLYSETILSSTATVIDVAFPANAKRVEVEFSAESSVSALIGFTLLQGGTPLVGWNGQFLYGTGASANSSIFAGAASVGIVTGTVASGTAKVFKAGTAGILNTVMNTYGAASGAYVNQQAIANNAALFSTVTGARLTIASSNFLTGSWMRSYVVI